MLAFVPYCSEQRLLSIADDLSKYLMAYTMADGSYYVFHAFYFYFLFKIKLLTVEQIALYVLFNT